MPVLGPGSGSPSPGAPLRRPCAPWATTLGVASGPVTGGCAPGIPAGYDPAPVLAVATEVVWALSGRRFGFCSTELRPCRRACMDDGALAAWSAWSWPYPSLPVHDGGLWWNLSCGCDTACGCTALSSVRLPRGPVVSVDLVKVDGLSLPISGYRVDNWRDLVRLGGSQFPLCQDMLADDSALGTWSVSYTYGRTPPAAGVRAVQELATELARADLGGPCALPKRVTSLTRGGMTMALLDPLDFLEKGRTGLFFVDLVIAAYNPAKLATRSRVYRADALPRGRRTGT